MPGTDSKLNAEERMRAAEQAIRGRKQGNMMDDIEGGSKKYSHKQEMRMYLE